MISKVRFPCRWNVQDEELLRTYPCDGYIVNPDKQYFMGININSSASVLFRWLCQLKVAPYSYDLIDNYGKKSPERLTHGAEELEIGQIIMDMFEIIDFSRNVHITMRLIGKIPKFFFGDVTITYYIIPLSEYSSRLIMKGEISHSQNVFLFWMPRTLPWFCWIMVRKQLLVLKKLAESFEQN